MISLDDVALARICIAATRVPNHARSKWLKRIASKLDPTPNAIYSARWTARQRNGRAMYRLDLDTVAVECLLQRERLLPVNGEIKRADVERALQQFISKLIELSEQDIATRHSPTR